MLLWMTSAIHIVEKVSPGDVMLTGMDFLVTADLQAVVGGVDHISRGQIRRQRLEVVLQQVVEGGELGGVWRRPRVAVHADLRRSQRGAKGVPHLAA